MDERRFVIDFPLPHEDMPPVDVLAFLGALPFPDLEVLHLENVPNFFSHEPGMLQALNSASIKSFGFRTWPQFKPRPIPTLPDYEKLAIWSIDIDCVMHPSYLAISSKSFWRLDQYILG